MTYTKDDVYAAILNEETPWEGSWNEFEESLQSTHEYIKVPEGTDGARSWDSGETFEKYVEKDDPGAKLPMGRGLLVESKGGGEGSGEERWYVFSITAEDEDTRYFRINGYYASFHGSDFDGPFEEVEPVERPVIFWEPIK
ncbi:hypothetical protein JRC04_05490 [Mycolicibacterium sp. S2-37]|uniref:hypothetical protein n=1 Tax=Mycolicibacterium sp. S2-37 TaxID=2810297 RepID=UPI001A949392|nr:hypothetical protein [Mycolicibacterium sp. S2-37]MBO0676909.1 hypothetical protein [Mycolicibacterium sp. S2-37]